MKRPEEILMKPIVTEKLQDMQEKNRKYGFQVERKANKIEIKKAVEEKFNVVVDSVRTLTVKGKAKRMNTRKGLTSGRRSDVKKAIVTLGDGYSIDFFEGQAG